MAKQATATKTEKNIKLKCIKDYVVQDENAGTKKETRYRAARSYDVREGSYPHFMRKDEHFIDPAVLKRQEAAENDKDEARDARSKEDE